MEQEYFEKALDWVKKRGFSNIKANHEDYETPAHYSRQGDSEDQIIPDISGLKTGGKSYIEIATKTDMVHDKVSKWKLLSLMAARKGGKLYLLTPRGHKRFAEELVKDYNVNAEIKSI